MIHPTVLFLAWLSFALALPWFSSAALVAASAALVGGVAAYGFAACAPLLRRIRYLLLAIIIIYAWATPGTPLFAAWADAWAPTTEGLLAGGLQAWRLLLIVTALALLLVRLNQAQLLAAIYGLLTPLNRCGVPRDRIAVRLYLSLQYVSAGDKLSSLGERWQAALTPADAPASSITLEIPAYTARDLGFFLGVGTLLWGAILW